VGHVQIEALRKEFVERRLRPRAKNGSAAKACQGATTVVLSDVDLEFYDGQFVCVLGPSGCGKTTLLRILAGFETKTSGSVRIDGKEISGPSSDNIFVFQHSGLLPWMTVEQNVSLGLRHEADLEAREERVREFIEMVELTDFEQHYPHQLSGGMQRRAELARALAVNPEILFMDEPFAGLDFLTRLKLREEIINMHELFRKTIVFITHDIDEALVMGDHLVVLGDRPARVKLSERLEEPHPRDLSRNARLAELRKELHHGMGVHFAI
jgi:ABC-type nitrate/sulfonate/bicarbonate transport system ATPase subunit